MESGTKDEALPRSIAFVGGTSEPGGLHVHTAEVAQACAALGHQVTIFCPSINYYEGLISDGRVAVECIPALGDGGMYERIIRWKRMRWGRPSLDIVLCRGSFGETGLFDLSVAAAVARRVFTIEHRPWEGPWPWGISKTIYGRLSSRLIYRSIAVSTEILASAEMEFSFPRRKMAACLNWVHPLFHPPTKQQRREADFPDREAGEVFKIGYLGRLAPEKRIDHLLRSFALLARRTKRPLELSIVGDGWKRVELMALANELNIGALVRFPGWSASPWETLREFDVFVLPSLTEGFPLALMEAMAVGCPCVAHPMSSARELIDSPRSGMLVNMNAPDDLARELGRLLEKTRGDRAQMGAAAAVTIAARFSRELRLPDILRALDIEVTELPVAAPRFLTLTKPDHA